MAKSRNTHLGKRVASAFWSSLQRFLTPSTVTHRAETTGHEARRNKQSALRRGSSGWDAALRRVKNAKSPTQPAPERGSSSASSTLAKRGLYLQTPRDRQTAAESWGRSLVKLTTRDRKETSEKTSVGLEKRCHFRKSVPLFSRHIRVFKRKREKTEKIRIYFAFSLSPFIPFISLFICLFCFQYCRRTLVVFIATRRLEISKCLMENLRSLHTHWIRQIEQRHLITTDGECWRKCRMFKKAPFFFF